MISLLLSLALTLSLALALANVPNMNGDVYGISNPNYSDPIKFSIQFSDINSTSEYFEVYSPPITSRYAEVYWTMMPKVELPKEIVSRFNGKIMAIVGYETDQVFDDGTSVPITWAYNHHYEAYLRSAETELIKVESHSQNDDGQYNHGSKELWKPNITGPLNFLFFSEANGGEFRQSFHGYPGNYAQLIKSPRFFNIQPMQIDTRNRDPKYINQTKFLAGILPKESAAPPNAFYSGLLECPCTTRIHKNIVHSYGVSLSDICQTPILNESICLNMSNTFGGHYNQTIRRINNPQMPYGCFYSMNEHSMNEHSMNEHSMNEHSNIIGAFINDYKSNKNCESINDTYIGHINDTVTNLSVLLSLESDQMTLTFSGNSSNWFGIAFNAHTMSDLPYAIIVDGYGKVFEHKLGNHDQGHLLMPMIKILENSVINGTRTVRLMRANKGLNSDYYTFTKDMANIPVLLAVGNTPDLKYHQVRGTNTLYLSALNGNTCICDIGEKGTINGLGFSKNCLGEPRGDLLQQHNPTCFIETYQGGLSCCHHKNVLLDADQIQPKGEMTYQLKFRFWFQEYYGQNSLERFYYQTEAYAGEYDIPKCEEGTPPEECIHSITAHFQGKDMVDKNIIGNNKGFKLIYLAPHCHAPSCIDVALYNQDTGDLICHVNGELGKGTDAKYDEEGYIKLNPCLFGEDAGLLEPHLFQWNTNFTSIKRNNNTNGHYGDMASWQMRGVIVN